MVNVYRRKQPHANGCFSFHAFRNQAKRQCIRVKRKGCRRRLHIITYVIWLMVFTLIINGIMYRDLRLKIMYGPSIL